MIRRAAYVFVLGFLALSGLNAHAQADNIVVLKPDSEVNRQNIKLSDVFSGIPEVLDRVIAVAPAPGKSVTYDVNVLKKLVLNNRLDWQPESLAERVTITRAATRITQDMIQAAVLERLKEENIKGKAEIVFDGRNHDIYLPADIKPAFAMSNFNFDSATRRFRSDIVVETQARPYTTSVSGRVIIKRDVPVLARRLERGVAIGEADITWITVAEDKMPSGAITDASQLLGREMRHDHPDRQILNVRDVIPPRLVTRGSLVTLKIQTPHMTITAQGRAMQDGAEGEVIRVTNTQSNRIVEGMVDASGTVRIQPAQKLVIARQ